MKRTSLCAVLVLLGALAAYATQQGLQREPAGTAQHPAKFGYISFTPAAMPGFMGPVFFFFDHETGNLWAVADPKEPPKLIGQLESFDKPLQPKPAK